MYHTQESQGPKSSLLWSQKSYKWPPNYRFGLPNGKFD